MKHFCIIFIVWIGLLLPSVLNGATLQINPICVGDTLKIEIVNPDPTMTYQLSGPLSLLYTFTDPDYTYSIPNADLTHNGTYYVIYTDATGIQTFSAVAVISLKPKVSVTSTPACVGSQVIMTATDANPDGNFSTFIWDINSSILTGNEITFIPLGPFTCHLIAVSPGGCAYDTVFLVEIAPSNFFSFSSNPMCSGTPLTITPFQEGTFLWHPTGETTTTIIPKVDVATIYSLDFTSKTGCAFTIEGVVYPLPKTDFSMSGTSETGYNEVVDKATVIMYNDEAVIDFFDKSDNPYSWYWDFGDPYSFNNNTSNRQDPSHIFTEPGKYTIQLQAFNSFGCPGVAKQDIYVELPFLFYIPNAFSPNEDGVNDFFCVSGGGYLKENFVMNIYDRHNRLLFHTNNPDDCWSGLASNGKPYPIATYYLNIQLMTLEGEIKEYHSTVTLVR